MIEGAGGVTARLSDGLFRLYWFCGSHPGGWRTPQPARPWAGEPGGLLRVSCGGMISWGKGTAIVEQSTLPAATTGPQDAPAERTAVVLVSGGLDSATVLALAREAGFTPVALTFDYGQRHKFELQAAGRVCTAMGVVRHIVFPLDLSRFGASALTSDLPVPKDRTATEMDGSIPVTYVPARNTVFLSVALALAESLGAADLFVGVNAVDYSGYPDCRPEYIAAFEAVANLATRSGVEGTQHWRVHTPLIRLTKADIIRAGLRLGVDYRLTHTCYDPAPSGLSCGRCDACLLRRKGFAEAGAVDPLPYQTDAP